MKQYKFVLMFNIHHNRLTIYREICEELLLYIIHHDDMKLYNLFFLKRYKLENNEGVFSKVYLKGYKDIFDALDVIKILHKNITFEKINKYERVVIIDEQEFLEITEKNFKGF